MPDLVIFLGGNGHCAARLAPARAALSRLALPLALAEPATSGFEGRPRAASFDAFLAALRAEVASLAAQASGRVLIYGAGIGGLLALCLRARGHLLDLPLLLQAPVLWGLERRLMPRVMRLGVARLVLTRLFALPTFQRWFARKHFTRPAESSFLGAFFRGYAECPAAADFFAWLTPGLLRDLERAFVENPAAVQRVRVWWGERDRVVTPQELAWTPAAVKTDRPVRLFPGWGHYPMIDEPEAWLRALTDELATTDELRR